MDGVKKQFLRTVSISVTDNTSSKFSFPIDNILNDNKDIVSIEAFRVGQVAKDGKGKINVADNVFNVASITLVRKTPAGENAVTSVPLSLFCRHDNNGIVEILNLDSISVTDCYIEVGETANLVADTVFILVVKYRK